MKKVLIFPLFVAFIGIATSCDDDEKYTPVPPTVSIENVSGELAVAQEDTLFFKAKVESPISNTIQWTVNGKEASTDSVYAFTTTEMGKHEIVLTAKNADGEQTANVSVDVFGKYKMGTFVLNEGNFVNGTLIFISPKGVITDSAYYKANGTMLGVISQDLFIANNKMYIISQNGGGDGTLVVANAETLKKEASYEEELKSTLSRPTHVAVLGDDNIYMRDDKGIYLFNPSSKKLTLITGSEGALKNRMAVANGKLFAATYDNSVIVIETGKAAVSATIDMKAAISGVIKASDGNLWVSCTSNPGKIIKVSSKDYSIIKENEVGDAPIGAGWGATPGISAKGDTLYFSNVSTKIYRHIFSSAKTDFMVDAATMVENTGEVYNSLAVNPVTGEVYLNTLKGFGGDYTTNHIGVFNFNGSEPKLSANYKDHTRLPAGTFFTYSFE